MAIQPKSKETEILRTGRLVFDAIFGTDADFEQSVAESEHEGALTVPGYSLIACDRCGQATPVESAEPRVLVRHGWQLDASGLRCPVCSGQARR